MRIYKNICDLIGNTPLVELTNIENLFNLEAKVLVKLESFNPSGSVKDRVTKAILDDAEFRGCLHKGSVIVEPTSGNTGIGIAAVSAARGYRAILTMPDTMSVERRKLLRAYGAELVLTDGALGMKGAISKADEIAESIPGCFRPGQFVNEMNPQSHFKTTGPEIWEDTDGEVDLFISGVGTGGTISGVGCYLKSKNPNVTVIAVEPSGSPVISGGKPGPHRIQGIGAGFLPATLDTSIIDEVVKIDDEDAFEAGRMIARTEGILAGISSGAVIHAALCIARRPENKGKTIVALLADTGERYLSSAMFQADS